MAAPSQHLTTHLLLEWCEGDETARDRLIPLVYDQLRRIAGRYMRSERRGHTLQPTVLVNEAYLRLVDQKRARWRNRAQFFAIASRLMRRILVDHARHRAAKGRGSTHVTLEEEALPAAEKSAEVVTLDEALEGLAEIDPRKARIIELRIFGGLTIEETAEVEGVSCSTVKNEYRAARAWLRREIEHRR
jgi:RNA polymerase sigma factor (TIGR02999 family)